MKRAEYVSTNEMGDIFRLGGATQAIEMLIKNTQEKDWLKKLKTCYTLLTQIIDERFQGCITNLKELNKLKKRVDNATIFYTTPDGVANFAPPEDPTISVSEEGLFVLASACADKYCKGCKEGENGDFEKCDLRNAYHHCGLPAMVGNPEGKCEFWTKEVEE